MSEDAVAHLLLLLALAASAEDSGVPAQEVRVQIDLQSHPSIHIPWSMFGRGLTDRPLKRRTWRHQFRQTISASTLADSEVRLFVAAALSAESARNPRHARKLVLSQFEYVEDFVEANGEDYALATSPAEVRRLLADTDKTVVLHSIEGMHHLLWDEGDARFWAERGVAMVTLIHLRDKELGGAAIVDKAAGPLINPKGAKKRRKGEDRGLTDFGEQAIRRLHAAGIVVDYTHLSQQSMADALALSREHGIPPLLTHSVLSRARPDEFGISDDQLVDIYAQGGLFATGLNAQDISEVPDGVCPGTVEAWAWHHGMVQDTLRERAPEIFGDPELVELSEAQRTHLATGWSGDWNGWTSHSTPVKRCRDLDEPTELDRKGLAHPGLLPQHWQVVEARGVSLDPMMRTAERFLQLWEHARGERERTAIESQSIVAP